jgi:hypothetical protein
VTVTQTLSTGAIIGIVAGVLVLVAILIVVICCVLKKRREKKLELG